MNKAIGFIAAMSIGLLAALPAAQAEGGNLVVYNPAGNAGDLVIDAFKKAHPDINVQSISGGVGELFTRIKAEAAHPRGDAILCASSEAFMANPGLFASYESKEADNFSKDVIGPDFTYYGCTMPLQAFVVNTNLLKPDQYPKTWKALGEAQYKDQLVLANPSLSGSAYAQLAEILQLYGWDVAEQVMANARFVTSSETVYQDVGRGEMAIGVTGESNIKTLIEQGYPVAAVYPDDGTGLRFDASAIIKGGPDLDNAKLFLDFANSKEAHELVVSTNRRSVRKDVAAPKGLPPTAEIKTFPYDAAKAADNRADNLAKWDDLFSK